MRPLHPAFGLLGTPAPRTLIRHVAYHWQARVIVWPRRGIIYGTWGKPIGHPCSDGYVRISRGDAKHQYAHRIIWEAVHGPIPAGLEVNHLNGRKADNRLANLALVTRRENVLHAVEAGLAPVGSERPKAKLNEDLVCQIRVSELPPGYWARELGVDPRTVRDARNGTTWRHVVCRGGRAVSRRRSRRSRRKDATGAVS